MKLIDTTKSFGVNYTHHVNQETERPIQEK